MAPAPGELSPPHFATESDHDARGRGQADAATGERLSVHSLERGKEMLGIARFVTDPVVSDLKTFRVAAHIDARLGLLTRKRPPRPVVSSRR